jgi:hypothetical protein
MLFEEEIGGLKELFRMLDADNSGAICKSCAPVSFFFVFCCFSVRGLDSSCAGYVLFVIDFVAML